VLDAEDGVEPWVVVADWLGSYAGAAAHPVNTGTPPQRLNNRAELASASPQARASDSAVAEIAHQRQ
jgi:hypothetical protein